MYVYLQFNVDSIPAGVACCTCKYAFHVTQSCHVHPSFQANVTEARSVCDQNVLIYIYTCVYVYVLTDTNIPVCRPKAMARSESQRMYEYMNLYTHICLYR